MGDVIPMRGRCVDCGTAIDRDPLGPPTCADCRALTLELLLGTPVQHHVRGYDGLAAALDEGASGPFVVCDHADRPMLTIGGRAEALALLSDWARVRADR